MGSAVADSGSAGVRGPRLHALDAWLGQHPDARVAALGIDALPTPMPPEIHLGPGHVVDTDSLLDLIAPDDRSSVSIGFVTARRTGQGVARARLAADGGGLEIHYMDLEPDLPVLVRMCIDDRTASSVPAAPERPSEGARLGIITKDEAARIVGIDAGAVELLGWRPEDVVGSSTLDLIHPDDHEKALENWWSMHLVGGSQVVRIRYRRGDGSWIWLDTSNSYDRGERSAGSVTCQVIDASREMAAADALRRNEQLLRRLAETVPVGLCFLNADCTVSFVNPSLAELVGTADIADLDAFRRFLTDVQHRTLASAVTRTLQEGRDGGVDLTLERGALPPVRCQVTLSAVLDQTEVIGVLACVVDVTELKRQASTDLLTGLLNRQAIVGLLSDAISSGNGLHGVLFLDLDRFKPVNDEYGHRVGDHLLVAVAGRLRSAVRDHDVVGRLGGDEFVVLCPGLSEPADLERVANRVIACLEDTFVLDEASARIGVSVGMALAERPDESADRLVARADSAMYEAKRRAAGAVWAQPVVQVQ